MYKAKLIVILVCAMLALTTIAAAGTLEKRHELGLKLGMWNQTADVTTEIGAGSVSTSVGNNGFLGGVKYGYWITEGLALNIGAGVMLAEVDSKVGLLEVSTQTASITQVLISAKIYFPKSTYNSSLRPYIRIGGGAYSGNQVSTSTTTEVLVESRSEMAFGGQGGLGLDYILGQHFMAGLSFGYNLISDFDKPIGGSNNYSGPEFTFDLSYLFGRP